jgi:ribosomal protein L11 methyltransferase
MMNSLQNSQKPWLTLSIHFSDETKEAIGNYLFELGCNGILEDKNLLIAYFPPRHDSVKLIQSLNDYLQSLNSIGIPVATPHIASKETLQEDWNAEWKKNCKPVLIKNKLMIKPSWLSAVPQSPPHIIEIDPQMAFGTGTHATTRLLLEFITDSVKGGESVLDIGTGTGILAIAAAKLGAGRIVALDIDPLAVETAHANIRKNNLQTRINLFSGTLDVLKKCPFSIIFTNINRIETLKILPFISELLDYMGKFFISGILIEEEKLIRQELLKNELRVYETATADEWIALKTEKIR